MLSRDTKPKPISFRVTDLLYIDDLKILVVKLNWVVNMVKTTMARCGASKERQDVCSGSCEKRSARES